jgi:hypothetical protein
MQRHGELMFRQVISAIGNDRMDSVELSGDFAALTGDRHSFGKEIVFAGALDCDHPDIIFPLFRIFRTKGYQRSIVFERREMDKSFKTAV